jgi:hypothetical protein
MLALHHRQTHAIEGLIPRTIVSLPRLGRYACADSTGRLHVVSALDGEVQTVALPMVGGIPHSLCADERLGRLYPKCCCSFVRCLVVAMSSFTIDQVLSDGNR